MKALKEKRISLRSLWRRGLVILSLFALVFASCAGDSDNDGGGGSGGGKKASGVVFPSYLEASQYLGRPVDLSGVTVTVYYSDGSGGSEVIKYEEHKGDFDTWPKVVTGTYDNDQAGANTYFTGMPGAIVIYDAGYGNKLARYIPFRKPAVGIIRDDTTTDTVDKTTGAKTGDTAVFANGLQLTGELAKKAYYVDDQSVDFSGLTLEADYDDGSHLPIAWKDVTWKIVPDYSGRPGSTFEPNADGTSKGWLYITVGEDTNAWWGEWKNYDGNPANSSAWKWEVGGIGGGSAGDNWTSGNEGKKTSVWSGGVTMRTLIPTVYTVKERKGGIEWDSDGDPTARMEDFFFFQENSPGSWTQRLIDANAGIIVHYEGDPAPKPFKIAQLVQQEIYWNLNMADGSPDDCGVRPIKYIYNAKDVGSYKGNANPMIVINYRGGRLELPINVYTTFKGISVELKDGSPGQTSLDETDEAWDNDVELPIGTSASAFAEMVNVYATYNAYNNKNAPQAKIKLQQVTESDFAADPSLLFTGPYYWTDFETKRNNAKWKEETQSKPKVVKQNIEIRYKVKSGDVEAFLGKNANTLFGQTKDQPAGDAKKKNAKVVWNLSER